MGGLRALHHLALFPFSHRRVLFPPSAPQHVMTHLTGNTAAGECEIYYICPEQLMQLKSQTSSNCYTGKGKGRESVPDLHLNISPSDSNRAL